MKRNAGGLLLLATLAAVIALSVYVNVMAAMVVGIVGCVWSSRLT